MHPPRRHRAVFVLLLTAATGPSLTGCAAVRQTLGQQLVPEATEIDLGVRLAAEVEAQYKVLADPELQRYVRFLAAPLIEQAWGDRPGIDYRITVLDDDDQVNAFALPGGPLYVFTGLLRLATDEAEVAGVLAHELGHVVARHSANQLGTQFGVELLIAVALGEEPQQVADLAAHVAGAGAMARFSRDDELQADDFGVRYTRAAGYDPRGLVSLFQKMAQLDAGHTSSVERFLSTHPETAQRIARIERRIGDNPGGQRHPERYLQATASLR